MGPQSGPSTLGPSPAPDVLQQEGQPDTCLGTPHTHQEAGRVGADGAGPCLTLPHPRRGSPSSPPYTPVQTGPALVTRPVCSLLPQAHPCTHSPKSTALVTQAAPRLPLPLWPRPSHSLPGWEVPPVPLLPQPPPSRPNPSARPSTARQDHPHRPCRPSQLPEGPALLARPLGTLTLTAASAEPELTPHDPARTPPPPGSPPAPPQLHTAAQRPVPSTVPGNRVCSSSSLPAARVAPGMGLLWTPGVGRRA